MRVPSVQLQTCLWLLLRLHSSPLLLSSAFQQQPRQQRRSGISLPSRLQDYPLLLLLNNKRRRQQQSTPATGTASSAHGGTLATATAVGPLFQSDTTASTVEHGTRWTKAKATLAALPSAVWEANGYLASVAVDVAYGSREAIRTYVAFTQSLLSAAWFCLPLLLCVVPVYTQLFHGHLPATPEFWKLVNAEYLWHSPDARLVVGFFLGSNLCYFLAGLYLLAKFPLLKGQGSAAALKNVENGSGRLSSLSLLSSSSLNPAFRETLLKNKPSRFTWLGLWTLLAGTVSTIFHAVQTYGDYRVAEGWCFLDHGVAISAILYFWRTCGMPQKPALILGSAGIAALSVPAKPGYAWLHSAWHLLSALAAVAWALQGRAPRRARLEKALVERQLRQL